MDGQPSLWETAAATLGEAPRVEILDLLHATGYLWEAVHLFHAPGSDLAQKWMKVLTLGLLSGMGTGVIGWLQHLAEQSERPAATHTRLAQIHDYFDRHRDRIHYDQYLAAGYPIASGVIEGACRHVVKDRMERAGMHWTLPGASPVEPSLRGAQRRVGAVHEPSHPTRNDPALCPLSGPTPTRPASPRRLTQGRARLVTPVAFNIYAIVMAALRATHRHQAINETVSEYSIAQEIATNTGGMLIAVPPVEWVMFAEASLVELGNMLLNIATHFDLKKYKKHPRGPKKPPMEKTQFRGHPHVSTAKLIKASANARAAKRA